MPRRSDVRAIFFDAGNTLIRMNFGVVAERLRALGVSVTADALVRAERHARVRLDRDVLARETDYMGGPEMAPQTPQRSGRPGEAGPPLDTARGRVADTAPQTPQRSGTRRRRRGAPRRRDSFTGTESRSTHDAYFRYVLDGVGIVDEAIVNAIAEWRRGYNLPVGLWDVPEPDAEPALALVRAVGLRTAVISNSNGSIRSIMASLGLSRYLDLVIDSSEVGVEKPDPRIFRLALERMALQPAQAVYIGDLYSVDVRGARAVGLDAILLDPEGCWGKRDCLMAPDVLSAVRLVLSG